MFTDNGNKTALQRFNIILNSKCDLENTLYVHTKCIGTIYINIEIESHYCSIDISIWRLEYKKNETETKVKRHDESSPIRYILSTYLKILLYSSFSVLQWLKPHGSSFFRP